MLDSARACVLAVGVRRTTLTDVARRAGVSRMTVYRRFPDVDALVRDLMTREFTAVLDAAGRAALLEATRTTARQRVVAQTVAAARAFSENALFRRVVDVDPELLLPYLVDRLGTTQRMAVGLFTERIAQGQADGSIRTAPPRTLAHAMLLAVQSFVLSMGPASAAVPADELYGELGHLLDAYLAP
ncbi:MAG: TetR/AcrR family transcriptional regulator [Carbonactinosporaceae bacterium]